MSEWVDCTKPFSNGTEFMLFVEGCWKCSHYRNNNCKILHRCYEAQFDISKFPYEWLLDHIKYGGKRCKRKTEKPLAKHKYDKNRKEQGKLLVLEADDEQ